MPAILSRYIIIAFSSNKRSLSSSSSPVKLTVIIVVVYRRITRRILFRTIDFTEADVAINYIGNINFLITLGLKYLVLKI